VAEAAAVLAAFVALAPQCRGQLLIEDRLDDLNDLASDGLTDLLPFRWSLIPERPHGAQARANLMEECATVNHAAIVGAIAEGDGSKVIGG
jgi:hypothetical protein